MFVALIVLFIMFLSYMLFFKRKCVSLKNKHVMITGGSAGIGLELAKDCVTRQVSNLTIVGRNVGKLKDAEKMLQEHHRNLNLKHDLTVSTITVDVSASYEAIKEALSSNSCKAPIDVLINNAGLSIPKKIVQSSMDEFQYQMDVNLLGCVKMTKAFLELDLMRPYNPQLDSSSNRLPPTFVYVASQAAFVPLPSMTGYCASKFGLRGFAESLALELHPRGFGVTVAFPPDTKTPGFEKENEVKGEECRMISELGGLAQPDIVASSILNDVLAGQLHSGAGGGIEGWLNLTLNCSMTPASIPKLCLQMFTLPLLRLIGWIYHRKFQSIVMKCHEKRQVKTD